MNMLSRSCQKVVTSCFRGVSSSVVHPVISPAWLPRITIQRSTSFSTGGGGARVGGAGGRGGRGGTRVGAVGTSGGGDEFSRRPSLWQAYLNMLESQPLLTKAWTCALLNGIGDLFCQLFVEKSSKVDYNRTLKFTALGAVFVAPALHYWYGALGSLVPFTGNTGAIMRLVLDQLVFAPIFIASFMSLLFATEGLPRSAIEAKLRQDLFSTVKMNWTIWVPAQFLNFRFVPPHLQVLASNVTALVWNTYLSYATHK